MKGAITAINCAFIKHTGTVKGRGVFASRLIFEGELIEVCPVVVLETKFEDLPEEFRRLVFAWGALIKSERIACLALGWGSMYNHGNPANVRYQASADDLLLFFSAAREIQPGEELTINYNKTLGDVESTKDVWFEDTGIDPIK